MIQVAQAQVTRIADERPAPPSLTVYFVMWQQWCKFGRYWKLEKRGPLQLDQAQSLARNSAESGFANVTLVKASIGATP